MPYGVVCAVHAQSAQLCPTLRRYGLYIAHQAPLSLGFSRQECWSELPLPSPGDLPNPGIEPRSPALQADSLPSELQERSNTIKIIYKTLFFS